MAKKKASDARGAAAGRVVIMPRWDVWSEGYATNGERGTATHHAGNVEAPTFKEACQQVFRNDSTYDPKQNTLWGCRLYPTERQARRSFG